jgi:S-adenosylmethionine:tRNA-ribosyltransferase-isomerase (queuine synthetase)
MRLNFDKTIKLNLSKEIEYKPAPRHEVYTTINRETKNYARLIDVNRTKERGDNIFKSILESLDPREAKILNAAKNKNLKMRGLSRKIAIEVWGNRIFN